MDELVVGQEVIQQHPVVDLVFTLTDRRRQWIYAQIQANAESNRSFFCLTLAEPIFKRYLAALHHGRQQTHVELRPRRSDVVFGSHQLDVLSAGQVGTERHCGHKHTGRVTEPAHSNKTKSNLWDWNLFKNLNIQHFSLWCSLTANSWAALCNTLHHMLNIIFLFV